jgi:ketosteroid isomerase-like protein
MLCLLVASALTFGCAGAGTRVDQPSASDTSSDSLLGANSLRAASDAWAHAAAEGDAEAMAESFSEDIFAMYPQPQPTEGRAANRDAWAAVFADPDVRHPVTTDFIVMASSGDLAYVKGRWRLSRPQSHGQAATEVGGRYIAVWQLQEAGRTWRIVALSANTHRPAPDM